MTKVYISNNDNTFQAAKYYLEIYAEKVDEDYTADLAASVPGYQSKNKWSIGASTLFIDILQRKRTITITGYIDKYSRRNSDFTANAANDAKVVQKELESFWRYGGTVKLILGKDDGYWNELTGTDTGTGAVATVSAVSSGVITSLSLTTAGTLYTAGTGKKTTAIIGAGRNCTVNITSVDPSTGAITALNAAPTAGGTGYAVNDTIYINGSRLLTGSFNSTIINAEVIQGLITKITFSEVGEDHYTKTIDSEDYPSNEFKLAGKVKIMISIEEGTI